MSDLFEVSATELARRIAKQEISPVEILEAHIAKIEEVNPLINALVVNTFQSARREAMEAEREILRNSSGLPRFFGVPFTVKELISIKGLPYTAGVLARKNEVGKEDSALVQRLRSAGGILLGTTNISEAGLWLETYNRIYGRTKNPYDLTRISGGSSGGEAALIAAGGSPMGIGADVGGSIRNPAFFNGICGHKPSGGLLPSGGHWPPAEGERGRYCVSGPMARSVEDLIGLMEVFSPVNDPYRDPSQSAFSPIKNLNPKDVTIYYFDDNELARPDAEVKQNISETVKRLATQGFRAEPWCPPGLKRSAEIWAAKIAVSGNCSIQELLGNGEKINLISEWFRSLFGRSNHQFSSLIMATFEGLSSFGGQKRLQKLLDQCSELQSIIENKLGDRGVLICPPYPHPAPKHHFPLLSLLGFTFAFTYCGIFNVLEFPATAVPTGFSKNGLPLGVQVVGKRFNDPLTLWVAQRIEDSFEKWKPAPMKINE